MRSGPSQRSSLSPQLQGPALPVRNWDATKSNAPAELLQRGFELAYFLIPDRVTAIDILTRALEKIRARSRREMKRLYWRDKHAERPVRRIARSDMDMLQWLIMFEAEQDERAQETSRLHFISGHDHPLHQAPNTDHNRLVLVLRQRRCEPVTPQLQHF